VSPWPGCATLAYLGLEPPLPYTFISRRSSWPENNYIKTPLDDRKMGRWRNKKHINKGCSSKD
jgi:hypothetical protein